MDYIIIGAARSGLAAYNLLKSEEQKVYLYDDFLKDKPKDFHFLQTDDLKKVLLEKASNRFQFVVSPGIPNNHWALLLAQKGDFLIQSELDLALKRYLGKIIAVTGTNGKSTVCAMLKHIADKAGIDASVCGNFGIPLCDLILQKTAASTLILELSSYQLEQSGKIYPSLAIFTSFAPDHLERHKTLESYFLAKWKLFDGLSSTPFIFSESAYNAYHTFVKTGLNPEVLYVMDKKAITRITSGEENLSKSIQLNGAMSALAMNLLFDVSIDKAFDALHSYKELPHRMQKVGEYQNCLFIDDSKATNVEATCHALSQMREPIYLLLGGQGKGESFAPLLTYKKSIARIFAFGSAKEDIHKELNRSFHVARRETLSEVMDDLSLCFAKEPKSVLLSPACASLDQFTSYAQRGEVFASLIDSFCKKLPK